MKFTQEDFRVIIAFTYRFWSFFDDKGRQNIDELMLNDRYLKQSTSLILLTFFLQSNLHHDVDTSNFTICCGSLSLLDVIRLVF